MNWFRRTFKDPIESHEEKVMRIYTYDWNTGNYPWHPKIPRFIKREDGSVYDVVCRYSYTKNLWDSYMAGFRHPERNHDFSWVKFHDAQASEDGRIWPRQDAVCSKCGEHRVVSMFIDVREVNKGGWCK